MVSVINNSEWLVWEISGSSTGRGGHKNLSKRREPSKYVSFRRAVERQRFHTLHTHDTKAKNNTTTLLTNALHVGTGYRSFRPKWPMAPSVVYLRKSFPSTIYTWPSLYDMNRVSTIGSQMKVKEIELDRFKDIVGVHFYSEF